MLSTEAMPKRCIVLASVVAFYFVTALVVYCPQTGVLTRIFVSLDGGTLVPYYLHLTNALWDPYVESGTFGLLEPHFQAMYPLAWLLKFKANALTFNVFLMSQYALAGSFMCLFLRELRLGRVASAVGGLCFMLGGFMAGHKMHSTLVDAGVWVPLILTFIERYLGNSRNHKTLAAAALSFCMLVLAGHPAMMVYGGVVVAAYTFLRIGLYAAEGFSRANLLESLRVLLWTTVPALFVCAVVFMPMAASIGLLTRQQIDYSYFASIGWSVRAAPLVLFPFLLGNHAGVVHHVYPEPYYGPINLWEVSTYIGVLPLAFCLLAIVFYRRQRQVVLWSTILALGLILAFGGDPHLPPWRWLTHVVNASAARPWRNVLCLAVVFAAAIAFSKTSRVGYQIKLAVTVVVMALVGNQYLYHLLYVVPVVNLFGIPVRHLFEVNVAMSALAAIGCDAALSNSQTASMRMKLRQLAMVLVSIVAVTVLYYFTRIWPRIWKSHDSLPAFGSHLAVPLVLTLISLLYLTKLPAATRTVRLSMVLFVAVDLFTFARPHYDFRGTELAPTEFCARILSMESQPERFRVSMRTNGICPLMDIGGNSPIWFKDYVFFTNFKPLSSIADNPGLLDRPNLFDWMSVKYVAVEKALLTGARLPSVFTKISDDGRVALYRNESTVARLRLAEEIQRTPSQAATKAAIYDSRFDPAKTVLSEELASARLAPATLLDSRFADDMVSGTVRTAGPSFLNFTDNWHPDWRAYVDDVPATVHRVNGYQMGVNIDGAGTHTVEFIFQPHSYLLARWISALSGAILIAALVLPANLRFRGERYVSDVSALSQ